MPTLALYLRAIRSEKREEQCVAQAGGTGYPGARDGRARKGGVNDTRASAAMSGYRLASMWAISLYTSFAARNSVCMLPGIGMTSTTSAATILRNMAVALSRSDT